MMALIAVIIGVNSQSVSAQELERDCAAVLRDAAARVRTEVEAGEMTAEEGRARVAGLRERCNTSDNDGERNERRERRDAALAAYEECSGED